MAECFHPPNMLVVDKARGTTTCTLCGEAVPHEQYELDPIFARPDLQGASKGVMRGQGGGFRPPHRTMTLNPTVARPSIDAARRGMSTIARELEISEDLVEMALGIYKLAVSVNAVSGTRNTLLCACLYAVCRRERTSHVIYDFSQLYNEKPSAILAQMQRVCLATHTEIPEIDPSSLILRFAEQMNLGSRITDVVVCALKILRVMQREWISYGRRPMGVCAAALLAACCLLGIPRTPEQVCGLVRLTAGTVVRRMQEFSRTPAAGLGSIDDYDPSEPTDSLPPAFSALARMDADAVLQSDLRELSAIYYELVAEAKVSTPATPERCEKWRSFFVRHCELEKVVPSERSLCLEALSPKQQLEMLGLRQTEPIPYTRVEVVKKEEEQRIIVKRECENQGIPYVPDASAPGPVKAEPSAAAASQPLSQDTRGDFQFDDLQLASAQQQFSDLLHNNQEVIALGSEFDFTSDGMLLPSAESLQQQEQQQPPPPESSAADAELQKKVLREALYDDDRASAMPWEILILPPSDEPGEDLLRHLVLDNEERVRKMKVGQRLYKEFWERGRPRSAWELEKLDDARRAKRRRTHSAYNGSDPQAALERSFRSVGARTLNLSNMDQLLPGYFQSEQDMDMGADWDE